MTHYIPRRFFFKIGKIFPSEQIVYAEVLDNKTVKTKFSNGYKVFEKYISYKEAYECIRDGIWVII